MSAASASCRPSPTRTHERRLFAARQRSATAQTKLDAYRIMAASMSLSYLGMRLMQLVVMVAGSYFVVTGRADDRRLRRLPAAGRRLLPPDREDQRGASRPIRRASPASGATRAARHRARHRRPARRRSPHRALRGRHPLRAASRFGYSRDRPVLQRHRPRRSGPARPSPSSGRRAPARRRSARCCRASTRSTPGASPSTASTSAT